MGSYYGMSPVKVSNIGNTKERYKAVDDVARYMWRKYKVWLFTYKERAHNIMANHIGWKATREGRCK